MHNSLKYFRDTDRQSLFAQMEAFLANESATGKSISIASGGLEISALLGYLPGNPSGAKYHFINKSICSAGETSDAIQKAIDAAANEIGDFICQGCSIENGQLSVVFLTTKS